METGYKLGTMEANIKTLQKDVVEIKQGMKSQDDKLDLLVADLNKRKGANTRTKALLGLFASSGFLGLLWEVFRK